MHFVWHAEARWRLLQIDSYTIRLGINPINVGVLLTEPVGSTFIEILIRI